MVCSGPWRAAGGVWRASWASGLVEKVCTPVVERVCTQASSLVGKGLHSSCGTMN